MLNLICAVNIAKNALSKYEKIKEATRLCVGQRAGGFFPGCVWEECGVGILQSEQKGYTLKNFCTFSEEYGKLNL